MKHQLITFRRIIVAGLKDCFRNSWLSVAATAVMVVSLMIILSTIVLNVTAQNAITQLSKDLKISIYLNNNAPQPAVNALSNTIASSPYVASVSYISQTDAEQQFIADNRNDQSLLEGLALVGGNSLPASLEVSVNNLSKMQQVGDIALGSQYKAVVNSVSLGKTDDKKTINRAASAQKYITTASVVAAIVFVIVSMLIIFNTIRMAIFTHSEEIKIMKLIGATPGYIRGPFLVESSIYGVLAAIIAASVVLAGIYILGGKVASQVEFSATYNFFTQEKIIVAIYLGTMLVGVLVGIVSSVFAMEKHLKLKHW